MAESRRLERFKYYSQRLLSPQNLLSRLLPQKFQEDSESLIMSPLEKWRKYRKIPWKLIIDILLVICVFFQILFLTVYRYGYLDSMMHTFDETFLPGGFDKKSNIDKLYSTYYFNNLNNVLKDMQYSVNKYFNLVNTSVDTFTIAESNGCNETHPISAEVKLFDSSLRRVLSGNQSFEISGTNIPRRSYVPTSSTFTECVNKDYPFGTILNKLIKNDTSKRDFFDRLQYIELVFSLNNLYIGEGNQYPECYHWRIVKTYDFTVRAGTLPAELKIHYQQCVDRNGKTYIMSKITEPATWFTIIIIFLSLANLILNIKGMIKRFLIFRERRKDNREVVWSDITNYITVWHWVTVSGAICNIIGGILSLIRTEEISDHLNEVTYFFLSLGVFFTLIQICKYYQFASKFYVLISALRTGLPNAIRFMISVFPVFIGYALAGTLWFGHYAQYFSSIDTSHVSLFACMHGDMIRGTFDMIFFSSTTLKVLSRIYLYIYVLLFICAVLNIFLLILEDAYFTHVVQHAPTKPPKIEYDEKQVHELKEEIDKILHDIKTEIKLASNTITTEQETYLQCIENCSSKLLNLGGQ